MIDIKQIVNKNNTLRRFVKKVNIFKEYMADAKEFSDYYLEMAEKKQEHEYQVMLLIHSLEKGMCMPELRPFGQQKAKELMCILSRCKEIKAFEYDLGVSALKAWVDFFDEHDWKNDRVCENVRNFLDGRKVKYLAGRKSFQDPSHILSDGKFEDILLSRHSVRNYEDCPINYDDLKFGLKCFINAPTACNRQMCKIYQIKNSNIRQILNRTVLGISGFNCDTVTYFIITYDISAFKFSGERNQGYVNAGLAAMNFVNGLHYRGIGSCFMQWSNKRTEDKMVRRAIGLPDNEKIVIAIGAGYYRKNSIIPCSVRRSLNEIYFVVK